MTRVGSTRSRRLSSVAVLVLMLATSTIATFDLYLFATSGLH
jgi:hypothetical protein